MRKRPPLGTEGAGDFVTLASDTDSRNIAGIDGTGEENCLLAFLRGWSEGGPWWPTAIPRDGRGTATATFTDPTKLTAWIDVRRGVDNHYFHVNDLSHNIRKKGDKGDVTRIRGFHVDIDARAPEGGWPQSEPLPERLAVLRDHCVSEHARIVSMVVEGVGWPAAIPRPTAAVDSGGCCQCFFRLHDDEEVAPDAAEALNQMLAAMLDGDVAVVGREPDHAPARDGESAQQEEALAGPGGHAHAPRVCRLDPALSHSRLSRTRSVCGARWQPGSGQARFGHGCPGAWPYT